MLSGISSFNANSFSPFDGYAVNHIQTISASYIETNYLSAMQADIDRIDADYASIGRVEIVEGRIDSIESDYVKTGELDATTGRIDDLETKTANIQSLEGNVVEIGYLSTNSINFKGGLVFEGKKETKEVVEAVYIDPVKDATGKVIDVNFHCDFVSIPDWR